MLYYRHETFGKTYCNHSDVIILLGYERLLCAVSYDVRNPRANA